MLDSNFGWALGSVVEHRLHTAGVSGSNPLAPTTSSRLVHNDFARINRIGITNRRMLYLGSVCNGLQRRLRHLLESPHGILQMLRPCWTDECGDGRDLRQR